MNQSMREDGPMNGERVQFLEDIDKFKNSHERRKNIEAQLTLKLNVFDYLLFWMPKWLCSGVKVSLFRKVALHFI